MSPPGSAGYGAGRLHRPRARQEGAGFACIPAELGLGRDGPRSTLLSSLDAHPQLCASGLLARQDAGRSEKGAAAISLISILLNKSRSRTRGCHVDKARVDRRSLFPEKNPCPG